DQAIQLGQVLGQFVQASPIVVVFLLRIFERAFNEDFVVTKEEWAQLTQHITQAAGAGPEGAGGQGGEQAMVQAVEFLSQAIDTLDPQLQAEVGAAIAEGVPLKQIVSTLMNQGTQPPQEGQPNG